MIWCRLSKKNHHSTNIKLNDRPTKILILHSFDFDSRINKCVHLQKFKFIPFSPTLVLIHYIQHLNLKCDCAKREWRKRGWQRSHPPSQNKIDENPKWMENSSYFSFLFGFIRLSNTTQDNTTTNDDEVDDNDEEKKMIGMMMIIWRNTTPFFFRLFLFFHYTLGFDSKIQSLTFFFFLLL